MTAVEIAVDTGRTIALIACIGSVIYLSFAHINMWRWTFAGAFMAAYAQLHFLVLGYSPWVGVIENLGIATLLGTTCLRKRKDARKRRNQLG